MTLRRHTIVMTIVVVTLVVIGIITVTPGTLRGTTITSTMSSTTTSRYTTTGLSNSKSTTTRISYATTTSTVDSTTSDTTHSTVPSTSENVQEFLTKSAPQSSQWLVLKESIDPVEVFANDTGLIPEYSTLTSLNETIVGQKCLQTANSLCTSWTAEVQTGWYFDSTNSLLYIHYSGNSAVEIIVTQ